MITLSIFVLAAVAVVAFGAGYALGFNVAKNPAKVEAQASKIVTDIKSKL